MPHFHRTSLYACCRCPLLFWLVPFSSLCPARNACVRCTHGAPYIHPAQTHGRGGPRACRGVGDEERAGRGPSEGGAAVGTRVGPEGHHQGARNGPQDGEASAVRPKTNEPTRNPTAKHAFSDVINIATTVPHDHNTSLAFVERPLANQTQRCRCCCVPISTCFKVILLVCGFETIYLGGDAYGLGAALDRKPSTRA